jgi:hypothetical protein
VIVKRKVPLLAAPRTEASTVKVPALPSAVSVDAVARPLLSVVSVTVWPPPVKAAPAPVLTSGWTVESWPQDFFFYLL